MSWHVGHQGWPPRKAQVLQYIPHSRHGHKNLHNVHRCSRAFDACCNLQKHYSCYSREGLCQEFLSTVHCVCWWGCKSNSTLIKHEDEIISWFSGMSFRLWSEGSRFCEGIKGVKHKISKTLSIHKITILYYTLLEISWTQKSCFLKKFMIEM